MVTLKQMVGKKPYSYPPIFKLFSHFTVSAPQSLVAIPPIFFNEMSEQFSALIMDDRQKIAKQQTYRPGTLGSTCSKVIECIIKIARMSINCLISGIMHLHSHT